MFAVVLSLFVGCMRAEVVIVDNNFGLLNHTMTCKFQTNETLYHRTDGRVYVLNPRYIPQHSIVSVLEYLYNTAQRSAINERLAALCLINEPGTKVTFGSEVTSPCEYCYTMEGLENATAHERAKRGGKHMLILIFMLPFVLVFALARMCMACLRTYKLYVRRDKTNKDTSGAIGIDVRTDTGEISE